MPLHLYIVWVAICLALMGHKANADPTHLLPRMVVMPPTAILCDSQEEVERYVTYIFVHKEFPPFCQQAGKVQMVIVEPLYDYELPGYMVEIGRVHAPDRTYYGYGRLRTLTADRGI
jgi:hypothetical protein